MLEGRGPWTVGRSQENDIVIPDPNVSRKHAALARRQRLRRGGPRLDQRHPARRRAHRPRADRERRRADLRPEHGPVRPPHRLPRGARESFGHREALRPCSTPGAASGGEGAALALALRLYLRRDAQGHRGPAEGPDDEPFEPGRAQDGRGAYAPRLGRVRARRRGLGDPGPRDQVRDRDGATSIGRSSAATSSSRATTTPRDATPSSPATGAPVRGGPGSTNGTFVNGRKTVGATP